MSCQTEQAKGNSDTDPYGLGEHLRIEIIDSCEYLENGSEGSNCYSLTHKGNCKFCRERNGH